jgi:hypothetical protein
MGGIAIILIIIAVVVIALIAFFVAGGAQALRHRAGGDLGPQEDGGARPEHRVAEPENPERGFGLPSEREPDAGRG